MIGITLTLGAHFDETGQNWIGEKFESGVELTQPGTDICITVGNYYETHDYEMSPNDVTKLVAFLTDAPPDSTLDTAMKLLRDAKSLHIAREMTQADHDVLRLAKTWGRKDAG